MPAPVWTINGTTLAAAGLSLASGSFRTQGVSTMRLVRAENFDATELLAFGATATLARDGTPFFQGKIASIPKLGSHSEESQIYEVADAWEDLETTIYQEAWALGASSYLFPRFVFGLGLNALATAYERVTVGKIIRNVIEYAVSVGVDLTVGSLPTGEIPIPSEEENLTCAEVIRTALKLHPDWIPWIDHSTSPPTFNVTPIASLTATSLAVDGTANVSNFDVVKRDDLLPESVRIVYEYATTIDNDVYRNATIDKYPALGPDGGPRVIGATIQLAGLQMQTQKSPVQIREIPTDHTDENVKDYLKEKFPHLAAIPDAAFNVTQFDRFLVGESAIHPDPINPNAQRLSLTDVDDLPNELLRGQINDWMRVRVGKIGINIAIEQEGDWSTATAAAKEAWQKGVPNITSMTATNAVTKVYKGISQWVAPEDVPTGIAQSVYQAIHAACAFQGNISITEEDVGATRYHGTKINLTGGLAAWATMAAPVHSVTFDVATGRTDIGFGPVPHLAPQDFLEMQRILRYRPIRWWSFEERGSNLIGGDGVPSAAGDTVVGYDLPLTEIEPGDRSRENLNFQIFQAEVIDSDGFYKLINIAAAAAAPPAATLYFRNGLFIGTTDPDDGAAATTVSAWRLLETA